MKRLVGALLFSFPLGLLTYGIVGIAVARYRHEGRFYSIPFGGYAVRDSAIVASVLAWWMLWFGVCLILTRTGYFTER